MHDENQVLENFSGVVRLFPLPNVVLFPHVIQPFHIFEPRYRQMTAEALTEDRLIAPVLLQPGWESNYEGRPPIHQVLCVGRIVAEQRLADGRYNLLVRGLCRARILQELPPKKPYRHARVEVPEASTACPTEAAGPLRKELGELVRPWFPANETALEQLDKLLHSDLTLGVLCDLLSFAVPLPMDAKQKLLEEWVVEARAQLLMQLLQEGQPPELLPMPKEVSPQRKFPPDFSKN